MSRIFITAFLFGLSFCLTYLALKYLTILLALYGILVMEYVYSFLLIKKGPPRGITNKFESCYMNSMIQAAASSRKFIRLLKNFKKKENDRVNLNPFQGFQERNQYKSLNTFISLLDGVNPSFEWNTTFRSLRWISWYLNDRNIKNKEKSIKRNTQLIEDLMKSAGWNKSSQQDIYDLFATLIKAIHTEINYMGEKNLKVPMKISVVHRFKNMKIPDKCQDHLGLSIGLCGPYSERPGVDLEHLIEQYFSPTNIDDDPDKTTQMFFYQEAPNILLLHIQANKWDSNIQEMIKPEYYIKYHEEMSLKLNIVTDLGVEETKEENVEYKLKAIVSHMGNISGGHYVAYRECSEGWFLVSDEQVEQMPFDSSIVPYILIYER